MPKFNFVDPEGAEWRIRKGNWFRWRVEQRTEDGWQLRAGAPTRKRAQANMTGLWRRVVGIEEVEHPQRAVADKTERIELLADEQTLVFEYARRGEPVPATLSHQLFAAHGRGSAQCLIYYHHIGIGKEIAYLMCVPDRRLA
jgi:hypothetical protein